jgi:hypothetical protein
MNVAVFEVLVAMFMKSSFFWDKMPFSLYEFSRRFGATVHLHLHCRWCFPSC